MRDKMYKILLDEKLFGTTKLEFGDPPLGVVFGRIEFAEKDIGYDFIKKYCIDNSIKILTDYPSDKLITTGQIERLKTFNYENKELIGIRNNIDCMDSEFYTITIIGLDNEIYKNEFPEHIIQYEQRFKD